MASKIIKICQRLTASLQSKGLMGTLAKLFAGFLRFDDYMFDLRNGTDTRAKSKLENLTINSENKERGVEYTATRVKLLRQLFEKMKPFIARDSVLVDLGCGKGRVLLVASEFGFREVRGVEFAEELCEIANRNIARYAGKRKPDTRFQVINSDVVKYRIQPEENVFFMYNPFDAIVLSHVLEEIKASLQSHPREILIIYFYPIEAPLIEKFGIFEKKREFQLGGHDFFLYSNADPKSNQLGSA